MDFCGRHANAYKQLRFDTIISTINLDPKLLVKDKGLVYALWVTILTVLKQYYKKVRVTINTVTLRINFLMLSLSPNHE